jgi:hypothetical protein
MRLKSLKQSLMQGVFNMGVTKLRIETVELNEEEYEMIAGHDLESRRCYLAAETYLKDRDLKYIEVVRVPKEREDASTVTLFVGKRGMPIGRDFLFVEHQPNTREFRFLGYADEVILHGRVKIPLQTDSQGSQFYSFPVGALDPAEKLIPGYQHKSKEKFDTTMCVCGNNRCLPGEKFCADCLARFEKY